jgi:hypothetical protein
MVVVRVRHMHMTLEMLTMRLEQTVEAVVVLLSFPPSRMVDL